ncbi:brefeldin A-inhibited guanine nucleotide-exchange protein 3 [Aedes aegypti]|uniref:Uncharacterized protein n=1 Tax=Aedes aegypti TaxID=7159 RepID=A0A6I8U6H9_AEDAE|nr:brefeldin A-inhibited guanine nucleotide-exchange protein 3 [Aedes aegypti]
MEELLMTIVKEATGSKQQNLKQAAQIAHDKLLRQHGIHRDPSYELRSVCFTALQMALETKRPKFVTYGLNGLHRIIRDERFFFGLEPEDDSLWLPAQLLRSTSGISTVGNEDTVVNVLRLFLSMACSPTCTLNGRLLIEVLSKCGECWENGSRAVKAASLAAGSQCLRAFCTFLKDEAEEILRTGPAGIISIGMAAAVYNEVIPVMQWLCSRLIEPSTGSPKRIDAAGSLYLMECILTLVTSLPPDVHANPHFTAFLWQKFCPTLAATLGSPGRVNIDKKFTYKDAIHLIESEHRGFFTRPGLDGPQARCIYLTSIQLLRIAGAQGTLRPMLEALFHRMLLLPIPANRAEPLRCVREILKSPERLIDLSVILYPDKNQGQSCSDDMALFRLIIDAMEECATTSQHGSTSVDNSMNSSVECIVALLESLQTLCSGTFDESIMSDRIADAINNRYHQLRESDYTGPLTYQSMARLPAPYRDAVAELRQNGFETSSESEIDAEHPIDPEAGSLGSGDTEGPEDEAHSSSDDVSSRADGNWPWAHLEEPPHIRSDVDCDRHHAREFAKVLTGDLVPNLLKLKVSVEVDEAIQEFASSVCQQNSLNYSDYDYNLTALNADGIYLATYSALLLALQLMKAGHYDEGHEPILIPLSEQQFVTSVQNAGVLVYLSSAWLRELYQSILASNPLATLKCIENTDGSHCALVDMLYDAGGVGPSQMLSDWQRLQSVVRIQTEPNAKQQAAKKLARRLLTCCWDSMVTVLTAGLGEVDDSRTARLMKLSKKTLRVKKKARSSGEALYALSLEGLHAAATLSNSLNLQHLAGKILNLIATNVCQNSGPKIPASQALSMDVVLSGGLELGSHSADCWLPVFSVCRHVTQLEHDLFSSQNAQMGNASQVAGNGKEAESPSKSSTQSDKLNLSSYPIDEDETCVDVYSFLQAPLPNSNANVATILKAYSGNDTINLSQADTAKMLCALSHQADTLFSDAAERLALPALLHFLKSLCRASREQLYRGSSSKKGKKSWWLGRPWKVKNDSLPLSLLLHRVGDVTLKVFRGPRPLLHILKVWAITGPHLMDAACHKDRAISKRAIEYIHDIITALLVEQSELPHFHFNEALLKPFENLLSMDSCDVDVQDQIVACLYEIVEAHRTEIRSGWRPLFGTLRTARNRPVHLSNIIDIFHVFLETDNTLVFANAGLDCILCLLSYLEISGSGGSVAGSTGGSGNGNEGSTNDDNNIRSSDFLYDALKFLERCSSILSFMYNMPQCPNLHSTYKIKGITYTHIIDANIPNSMENFTYFGQDYLQSSNEQYMISYRSLHIDKETITKIDELDKPSGVLKVWFLLLDGLTNSLIVCPIAHQSPILQSIFKLFKSLLINPGIEFGFYCINHLLIPMIQDWLRYVNKAQKNWSLIEKNFKHCCCMTTDLVVEFIEKSQTSLGGLEDRIVIGSEQTFNQHQQSMKKNKFTSIVRPVDNMKYSKLRKVTSVEDQQQQQYAGYYGSKKDDEGSGATKIPTAAILALKQLLLVLIECSAQSQETIARVGVSCMKHIIFSTGHIFNEDQWMVITSAIHRASTVTMAPLRQLIFAFNENSNSFYGDCANVKVAARRDSTLDELQRVHSLAQQVFLMDNQRDMLNSKVNNNVGGGLNGVNGAGTATDDRSYSFLLYPLNCNTNMTQSCSVNGGGISASLQSNGLNLDSYIIRIPYRNLVVGLLASQMLLQLIANILLNGLTNVPNELNSCIYNGGETTASNTTKALFQLGYRSKEVLLRTLKQFLICSMDFDLRPGLKFLIQKVSNIESAANLYKQMTSSWIINYMTLVDVYINNIRAYNLNEDDIKYILDSCSHMTAASQQWKKNENFVHYLLALRDLWDLIAEHFIDNMESNGNDGSTVTHIVENKLEKYERFDDKLDSSGGEEDPSSSPEGISCGDPSNDNDNPGMDPESPSKSDEESVSVSTIVGNHGGRMNPFNISANQQQHLHHQQQLQHQQQQQQSISPEIEQQRTNSIQKDLICKRSALKQLIVASMELLKLLPEEQAELLKLLLTPKIREAFRVIQEQGTGGLTME